MIARPLIFLIRIYQKFISPMIPPSCKYHPSCSAYAVDALRTHGALKGTAMAIWRVLRCNPFSKGGYDPVIKPDCCENEAAMAARK